MVTKEQNIPGNWVYVNTYWDDDVRGKVFQISTIDEGSVNILNTPCPNKNGGYNIPPSTCRLALPHEIPGYKKDILETLKIW